MEFMLIINVSGYPYKTVVMLVEVTHHDLPLSIRLDWIGLPIKPEEGTKMSYIKTQKAFLELLATVAIKPVLRLEDAQSERKPRHAVCTTDALMMVLFPILKSDLGKLNMPEDMDESNLTDKQVWENTRLIFFANSNEIIRNEINFPGDFGDKFTVSRTLGVQKPKDEELYDVQVYVDALNKLDIKQLVSKFDDERISEEDKVRLLENGRTLYGVTLSSIAQSEDFKRYVKEWVDLGIDRTYTIYCAADPSHTQLLAKLPSNFWFAHDSILGYHEFFPGFPNIQPDRLSVLWCYGADLIEGISGKPFQLQPNVELKKEKLGSIR